MSSPDEPGKPADEVERRRRAAELLGDLLPDTTTDESPEGWGERESSSRDDDYLRDVPPHHG
ncbi:hypothetical protein [Aeromicrobium sp. NPDC092404]|uniref:hypothetical protein n=1 Tax=Aeromicrobium sp. NPDC092404 TaxID=3154976 RepID=UPI0034389D86